MGIPTFTNGFSDLSKNRHFGDSNRKLNAPARDNEFVCVYVGVWVWE